eukprot:gene48997-66518_t
MRERDLQMATEAALDAAQALADQLRLDARTMDQADLRLALASAQVRKFEEEASLGNLSKNSVDGAVNGVKQSAYGAAAARASFLARWSDLILKLALALVVIAAVAIVVILRDHLSALFDRIAELTLPGGYKIGFQSSLRKSGNA